MAKHLVILLAFTFLGAQTFASKARLGALGQGTDGSYFIDDSRNIFLNPADINGLGNQLNVELGNNTVAGPKAEGGVIHTEDFGVIGLHLGRLGMGAQNILAAESDLGFALFNPQNSLELFYGTDMGGMKVGGSLHYANSDSNTGETANLPDSSASIMELRAGVATDVYSAHLDFGMTEEASTEDVGNIERKYDGSTSLKLGGSYTLSDDMKVAAEIKQLDFAFDNGAGLTGDRGKQEVSVAFFNKLSDKDGYFIFYTIGLTQASQTIDYEPVATDDLETSQMYLPIVIGGEAQVRDWMVLRASVRQNTLIDSSEGYDSVVPANELKTNNLDDTTVSAGIGLMFEKVTIDGVLTGASGGTGMLDGNNLMSQVALKYEY